MKKRIPGEVILLLTAVIWGYGFVAVANSLDSMTPFQLLFLRFGIASVVLSTVFFRRLRGLTKPTIRKGAILGALLFLGFVLQTIGMTYTTPSKNAFLTGVNVIIVPLIAWFLYKRKLTRQEVAGSILAMIGIGLLTLQFNGNVNIGDLLTLGCAVAFAFQIFYTTLFMDGENPVDMALVQIITSMLLSGGAVLLERAPITMPPQSGVLSILYLAIFSTSITTILQSWGQKYSSETRSAILLSTESLWGTLFSFLFLGEAMTLRLVAGGLIIFASILLAQIKPKEAPSERSTPAHTAHDPLAVPDQM